MSDSPLPPVDDDFVDLGLLVIANPQSAKKYRRYTKPDLEPGFGLFADLAGK